MISDATLHNNRCLGTATFYLHAVSMTSTPTHWLIIDHQSPALHCSAMRGAWGYGGDVLLKRVDRFGKEHDTTSWRSFFFSAPPPHCELFCGNVTMFCSHGTSHLSITRTMDLFEWFLLEFPTNNARLTCETFPTTKKWAKWLPVKALW